LVDDAGVVQVVRLAEEDLSPHCRVLRPPPAVLEPLPTDVARSGTGEELGHAGLEGTPCDEGCTPRLVLRPLEAGDRGAVLLLVAAPLAVANLGSSALDHFCCGHIVHSLFLRGSRPRRGWSLRGLWG